MCINLFIRPVHTRAMCLAKYMTIGASKLLSCASDYTGDYGYFLHVSRILNMFDNFGYE